MRNKADNNSKQTAMLRDPDASGLSSALRSVALILARHELRSVRRLYDAFDRDILLPLLLGEIALHNIGVLENADEDVSTGDWLEPEAMLRRGLKPCNAYSIAAATGLPRETVRRKIARLAEKGWIRRNRQGHLYVTTRALAHFGQVLTSRELPELLATADRVRNLLEPAGCEDKLETV